MYLDTSMALKLYVPEAGSEAVQRKVQSVSDLYSSELMIPEFRSALSRREQEHAIDARDAKRIWSLFRQHLDEGRWRLLSADRAIMLHAAEVMAECRRVVAVRTLDAIHLATCLHYRLQPLFTADQVMLRAAARLKIQVETL